MTFPSIGDLKGATAIGSPTARQLLAQIQEEERQAKQEKEAAEQAKKHQEQTERGRRVAGIQHRISEHIEAYEEFRKLAQDALNSAFKAASELPAGVSPNPQFDFLQKAHLPTAYPKGNAELWPVFSTTEGYLHQLLGPKK